MSDYVKESMKILSDAGYKYTPKRADMLRIFDENEGRYITPKEVQELIYEKHPQLSFDTIYRNLKLFRLHGILEETEINGEMAFRKKCSIEMGHHHHFICSNCGSIKAVELCPLEFFEEQLPGYAIVTHTLKLEGLCPECRKLVEESI